MNIDQYPQPPCLPVQRSMLMSERHHRTHSKAYLKRKAANIISVEDTRSPSVVDLSGGKAVLDSREEYAGFMMEVAQDLFAANRLYLVEEKTSPFFILFMDLDCKCYASEVEGAWTEALGMASTIVKNVFSMLQVPLADPKAMILEKFESLKLAEALQNDLPHVYPYTPDVILTSGDCKLGKPDGDREIVHFGIHLHFPRIVIDQITALYLRTQLLKLFVCEPAYLLPEDLSKGRTVDIYSKVLDQCIYLGTGLRMYGCHKATPHTDCQKLQRCIQRCGVCHQEGNADGTLKHPYSVFSKDQRCDACKLNASKISCCTVCNGLKYLDTGRPYTIKAVLNPLGEISTAHPFVANPIEYIHLLVFNTSIRCLAKDGLASLAYIHDNFANADDFAECVRLIRSSYDLCASENKGDFLSFNKQAMAMAGSLILVSLADRSASTATGKPVTNAATRILKRTTRLIERDMKENKESAVRLINRSKKETCQCSFRNPACPSCVTVAKADLLEFIKNQYTGMGFPDMEFDTMTTFKNISNSSFDTIVVSLCSRFCVKKGCEHESNRAKLVITDKFASLSCYDHCCTVPAETTDERVKLLRSRLNLPKEITACVFPGCNRTGIDTVTETVETSMQGIPDEVYNEENINNNNNNNNYPEYDNGHGGGGYDGGTEETAGQIDYLLAKLPNYTFENRVLSSEQRMHGLFINNMKQLMMERQSRNAGRPTKIVKPKSKVALKASGFRKPSAKFD